MIFIFIIPLPLLQNVFVRYPNNPVAGIKPPNHPTVIKDLPFVGKTQYGETFKGTQMPLDPEIEYMKKKNKYGFFK